MPPILSDHAGRLRLPAVNPPAVLVVITLWMALACAVPLYQLQEARRQGREDLLRVLAADKPPAGDVLAVFDHSNQNLDAAAAGPCLFLAFTGVFLANQFFRLKRRCDVLAQRDSPINQPQDRAD